MTLRAVCRLMMSYVKHHLHILLTCVCQGCVLAAFSLHGANDLMLGAAATVISTQSQDVLSVSVTSSTSIIQMTPFFSLKPAAVLSYTNEASELGLQMQLSTDFEDCQPFVARDTESVDRVNPSTLAPSHVPRSKLNRKYSITVTHSLKHGA